MSKIRGNTKKSKSPFSSKDLSIFCEQISMLINSGIMLHDGIEMMAAETADTKIKAVLKSVLNELVNGSSFENALSASGVFPDYMINLVAIGSESGTLDKTMKSLATYYGRQADIGETLKSAILYPSVLIVMMITVLIFLSVKVLPIFENVLQSLGANLSPVANAIMAGGQFFNKFSLVFIVIIVILAAAAVFFVKSSKGKAMFSDFIWQTKIFEALSISTLASSMHTTLSSGLDPERAFELSAASISNKKIKKKIEKCTSLIKNEYLSLAEAIAKSELFSGISSSILNTGIAVGSLDNAMKYVADLYEDNFETTLIKRISLIEPISVAVLSTLIGIILISVMLPLLSVMSVIGA